MGLKKREAAALNLIFSSLADRFFNQCSDALVYSANVSINGSYLARSCHLMSPYL
jgi:hypothetical protein